LAWKFSCKNRRKGSENLNLAAGVVIVTFSGQGRTDIHLIDWMIYRLIKWSDNIECSKYQSVGVGVLWLCMSRNPEVIWVSGVWIDSASVTADLYDPIPALASHSLRKCSLRARGSTSRWVARWRSEELIPSWGPRKKGGIQERLYPGSLCLKFHSVEWLMH